MTTKDLTNHIGQTVMAKYFVPSDPNYRVAGHHLGCVKYWKWTKRSGLVCHTRDGQVWKSDWGTLRAFRIAVRERRETAVNESAVIPASIL